jgi:hypothetical protein
MSSNPAQRKNLYLLFAKLSRAHLCLSTLWFQRVHIRLAS